MKARSQETSCIEMLYYFPRVQTAHIMETHAHNFQDFSEVLVLIEATSAIAGGININCLCEESIISLK